MSGARRLEGAGIYTAPHQGTTHWVEHLRSDHLSVGTYSVVAQGSDDQVPHTEDEVYVVTAGRALLSTPSGSIPVEPGHALFVPAGEPHIFVDISEDFAALVLFAPPEIEPS
ncbi:MAG TPA: cupin domain-containing protein [Acidimicrobiales bacterium]